MVGARQPPSITRLVEVVKGKSVVRIRGVRVKAVLEGHTQLHFTEVLDEAAGSGQLHLASIGQHQTPRFSGGTVTQCIQSMRIQGKQ